MKIIYRAFDPVPDGMKSFRIYLRKPPLAPSRVVSDYSSEELESFREAFADQRTRYQRRGRVVSYLLLAFTISLVVVIPAKHLASHWLPMEYLLAVQFALFAATWVAAMFFLPVFFCPACTNSIYLRLGPWCPVCGKREIEHGNWRRADACRACGWKFLRSRYSQHRARYCSHCGVHLTDEGVRV